MLSLARPWDSNRLTAAYLLALLPALSCALYLHGAALLPSLVLSVVVALFWQGLFCRLRGRPFGADGVITGVCFALLISAEVSLAQQALALSFGVVIGEQVFGGRGLNFLNPAIVALAFAHFNDPAALGQGSDPAMAVAALVGGLWLLALGVVSIRVLIGIALGMACTYGLVNGSSGDWLLLCSSSVVFGSVFLVGDPVAAAATNPGRWAYGLLCGALIVLLGQATPGSTYALVFAALLSSTFAPLTDRVVIALNVYRRRRRHA